MHLGKGHTYLFAVNAFEEMALGHLIGKRFSECWKENPPVMETPSQHGGCVNCSPSAYMPWLILKEQVGISEGQTGRQSLLRGNEKAAKWAGESVFMFRTRGPGVGVTLGQLSHCQLQRTTRKHSGDCKGRRGGVRACARIPAVRHVRSSTYRQRNPHERTPNLTSPSEM